MLRLCYTAFTVTIALGTASQGWAAPLSIQNETTMSGDCVHLQIYGQNTNSHCDGQIAFVELKNGRNAIVFTSVNGARYWFAGPRSGEIHPDEDVIFLPIDGVRVAGDRSGADQKAVGTCSYGNPYLGKVHVQCHAETMEGPVYAEFTTDGKEPALSDAPAHRSAVP